MKTDHPETESEVSPKDAKFWLDEISAAQARNDCWYDKAEEAEERYRDEDDDRGFGGLNIFWSNVETQKAAIGEDFGKPQVTRVNMPEDDGGLARHAAMVWERAIEASVKEADDNHDIALAVGDVFIPGKGQVWIEVEADERKWVSAAICRVCYPDYLEGPATRWGGIPWVARRHYFTRDELQSQCKMSEERAEKVPLNIKLPTQKKDGVEDAKGKEQFKRAEVWEIWAKHPEKARIFVAVGHKDEVLRYDKDPLGLKKFLPCPRPMQANGDESKPPLTDYSRYQDQAEELDRLSERIFVLTETLRRTGIHDKAFKELADMAEAEENTTIAVENWAHLQAAGGLSKVQEWQDILPIAQVLAELHKQRDTLLRLIYELSGISDLARGHTDPDETLGAQKLKQSFGSNRFKRREKDSRRFASEAYQLKGEVIAELFPREQLEQMSGMDLPLRADIDAAKQQIAEIQRMYQQAQQTGQQLPPPNQDQITHLAKLASVKFSWEDVSGLLRSDVRRCYNVEVETDQTAFVDEESDKANATQFFGTVMQAIQQIGPMIAGNPKNGEIFKQLVMFVVSRFKAGRSLEEGLEQAIDGAIEQAVQQQGQQQQDPKAAADAQIAQARVQESQIRLQQTQVQMQTAQIGLQRAQLELQAAGGDIQAKAIETQLKSQDAQTKQLEASAKAQESQRKIIEGQQKVALQDMQNQAKQAGLEIDLEGKYRKLQFEAQQEATAREQILKDNDMKEQQRQAQQKAPAA